MSAVVLQLHRTPARVAEAYAIAKIRQDCLEAGLNAHQVQRVLARARQNLRQVPPETLDEWFSRPGPAVEQRVRNLSPRYAMLAVATRAKAAGLSSFTLLDGLQAAMRALLDGRSSAVAYQAGVAAMRQPRDTHGLEGGAA